MIDCTFDTTAALPKLLHDSHAWIDIMQLSLLSRRCREPEEVADAERRFLRVSKAYELLGGGVGSGGGDENCSTEDAAAAVTAANWYASLGGKGRTEFAPLDLAGQKMGAPRLAEDMDFEAGGECGGVQLRLGEQLH